MSLNVDQILRWYAVNTEQNEGSLGNTINEADLWLESGYTKGTLPFCVPE